MIILDSSFLVAYHNRHDVHHQAAVPAMEDLIGGKWGRALLLEYVFLEVATVLLARRGLQLASVVAHTLLQAQEIDFVPCSDLFMETLGTFRGQPSGALSFTDAAIVALARRQEVRYVATFDGDFKEIEGIQIVPAQ